MHRKSRTAGGRDFRPNSFTLVELLTVMAIIALLAALTIGAASGVLQHGARSRAAGEIAEMRTGLDSYKVDNGAYPASGYLDPSVYASSDGSTTAYQTNAQTLYQALQGKTNFTDTTFITNMKAYVNFRANQVGNLSSGTYAADPWGLAYGYSTGYGAGSVAPYSGSNSFDMWSTGGVTYAKWTANPPTSTTLTNAWINTWQQ